MADPFTPAQAPTHEQALANAARLLQAAEVESDRGLMERYTELANTWVSIADIQAGLSQT